MAQKDYTTDRAAPYQACMHKAGSVRKIVFADRSHCTAGSGLGCSAAVDYSDWSGSLQGANNQRISLQRPICSPSSRTALRQGLFSGAAKRSSISTNDINCTTQN